MNTRLRVTNTRRLHTVGVAVLAATMSGCLVVKTGGVSPEIDPEEYAHEVSYHISCSVSDECRVTYIDREGELRKKDVTGEWEYTSGANPGSRFWVRAGAGGCPPRPVRVEIWLDGTMVAEHLMRPPGGSRCQWILAETEFRVP